MGGVSDAIVAALRARGLPVGRVDVDWFGSFGKQGLHGVAAVMLDGNRVAALFDKGTLGVDNATAALAGLYEAAQ